MAGTLAYLYQLQGESYANLSSTSFKVGVIDQDDASLTNTQISGLEATGKTLLAYLSIGEAESYRSYWQPSWNTNPPSFLLGQNPDWPGSYEVKFWDPAWQQLVIGKAVALAQAGYNGMVMDVVDVYDVASVAAAYHGTSDVRTEMMKFVSAISDATKAINPNFKIIQNNGLDLLTVDPTNPASATNTSYLAKIDGVNAESTFYNQDNTHTSWQAWNLQYLQHAVDAGKTVFAIDYPTSATAQQDFINQAIAHHFVPMVGDPNLATIPTIDYQISSLVPASYYNSIVGSTTTSGSGTGSGGTGGTTTSSGVTIANGVVTGTDNADTIYAPNGTVTIHANGGDDIIHTGVGSQGIDAGAGNDTVYASGGWDWINGGSGNDQLYGGKGVGGFDTFAFYKGAGNDVIHDFQNPGSAAGDSIDISSAIYKTVAQVLSHITYSGGNAIIQLDGANTITVAGVSATHLTAADFHII